MLVVMLFLVRNVLTKIASANGVEVASKEKSLPIWKAYAKNQFLILVTAILFLLASAYFVYGYFMQVGVNQGYEPVQEIHYSHRISAIFVTLIFAILITRLWFSNAAPLASTLGLVLVTQISLGIMNVVYVLPLYIAIAHNLVAAALLLTALMVNFIVWKK